MPSIPALFRCQDGSVILDGQFSFLGIQRDFGGIYRRRIQTHLFGLDRSVAVFPSNPQRLALAVGKLNGILALSHGFLLAQMYNILCKCFRDRIIDLSLKTRLECHRDLADVGIFLVRILDRPADLGIRNSLFLRRSRFLARRRNGHRHNFRFRLLRIVLFHTEIQRQLRILQTGQRNSIFALCHLLRFGALKDILLKRVVHRAVTAGCQCDLRLGLVRRVAACRYLRNDRLFLLNRLIRRLNGDRSRLRPLSVRAHNADPQCLLSFRNAFDDQIVLTVCNAILSVFAVKHFLIQCIVQRARAVRGKCERNRPVLVPLCGSLRDNRHFDRLLVQRNDLPVDQNEQSFLTHADCGDGFSISHRVYRIIPSRGIDLAVVPQGIRSGRLVFLCLRISRILRRFCRFSRSVQPNFLSVLRYNPDVLRIDCQIGSLRNLGIQHSCILHIAVQIQRIQRIFTRGIDHIFRAHHRRHNLLTERQCLPRTVFRF